MIITVTREVQIVQTAGHLIPDISEFFLSVYLSESLEVVLKSIDSHMKLILDLFIFWEIELN